MDDQLRREKWAFAERQAEILEAEVALFRKGVATTVSGDIKARSIALGSLTSLSEIGADLSRMSQRARTIHTLLNELMRDAQQ